MGTRGWMLSTFVGCYIWILHGLGAAAIPVTTEGPFAAGTASSIPAESEGPQALVIGTAETTTAAADAEIAESILAGSLSSPSISPGTELDALVTAASEYGSTRPTLMNVTKPLNSSQDSERASAAPAVATTTASISAQHPAVTPEAELDVTRATPSTPLGTTPLFTDVKEDILVAVTREGTEDLDSTPGSVSLPTTPPPAAASGEQPTAGSTVGAGVTALPSQGLTTAMGAVKEGVTLPVDIQSEASANSSSTSPGAEDLLMTQQDGVVSEAVGISPEPTTEMAPAAEEGPLALVSGNTGDAVNGEFSTSSSSHLPPESPTVSGTVGNPGEPSLLPGQVELNPAASLTPPVSGDGDGQGAPRVLSEVPGSGLSPATSEATVAPGLTEDMATSLLGSSVPADAQSDSNLPVPATALPRGDTGAVGLAKPAPWQIPTREQPLFPSPMDTSSSPGAAYPSPGAGTSTLPAADDEAETPASLDLGVAQGTSVSPSLEGSQPWDTAAGGSQGVDGPDTGLSSASDASIPASFLPDGLTQPAAGVQGQGVEDAGDMAQAGGPRDGSPYAHSQSDTNASAFSAQQDPTTTGDLAAGGTGTLANAELSPLSPLEDGAGAEVPGLGQVSLTGPAPPGSAGLEPNLSGAEGPGGLPIDSPSISEAAYPPPGAAAGPVSGAETPASPDLGAVQGVPISSSPEESQPWGTAAGGSQGVDGPDTGLSSGSDASTPASFLPDGLTQPAAEVQGQGIEGVEDMTQAGGPRDGSPYEDSQSDTNASAFSAQQDPTTTGDLAAGGTETLANAELSPLSPLEDGAGAGEVPGLGQVSLPGPAPPGSAVLEPDSSGAEGPGDLPSESNSISEAAYPRPGAAAGPVSGAETPASPDLGSVWGVPVSPSPEESQPWGTAAGAFQGAGLPGAKGPGTSLALAWDAPSSAAYGPAGLPSAALGDQLGTNLGLPTAEVHGASTAEQALGGAGSETGLEPPLSSAAGSGMAPGMDQLPGEGSSSSAASPNGVVAAPSVLDPASPSALGGAGSAPGALQPSPGAGPGVPPAAGEVAGEGAGDEGSLGQFQASDVQGSADSGAHDKEMGSVLQSASSLPSTEESSSAGTTSEATNGASLPGTGGTRGGLSTGLETAGPEEPPMSVPGIQSGADLGLSDAKLSQVNVVEVPGGASVNGAPSSGASLGEGAGAIIQIASGALAPSALASPQEVQPLVPVASESSGGSNGMASSLAASLLLPGHGLSSGLAPNGDPHSAPDTQSGSKSLEPGAPGGLSGDAGGDQTWSLEDEVASGMPAPLGEAFPHAPASPNAAPALPSAPRGENAAEGVSTSPGLSSPFSARESIAGSSAGGRGELGAAAPGGSALPLPPHQPGSPGAPSRDADSPMPGDASAMLPGAMAGRGDVAQLLPSATGAGESVETPARTLLGGSPGLPPAGIAAGSPGSKTPGPGPAGVSSPSALQPVLGHELTTSLAKEAPAAGGSNLPAALPGQGGAQGGSPTTARSAMSCSPATTSPALPAQLPRGREVLPRPGAATVSSHASSPMFPAPPRGPAAAQTPLPGPTVAAMPLYRYGARENDREYVERKVDFNSPLFKPETGFPFGKTLRNSLYFTDNGQIIFPSSDHSIFTYPNPPASGFNGHEEVPMIAVFWDNADFSRGIGTTFYQEFLTLNTAKPPFVRDVEAKVRQYLRSSYSAAWTLKITWEKAPAYAARTDTRRTITYQAILTTDGFRSYILMLYQEGGMQWDYTRLAATNVLIGYTSGDGFYRNDDLTQRPPAAKYRPDQFRGYNTDLRGLWIYKLESRVGVNYRLKCLAWTGRQQEPQAWSQDLPACPCSLQQGQQDPRFKNSRRGWWAARVSMLHSASPNQHGAGIRCLYDSQGQLIEGRQERYWRSSRQASPYRDQELKLYDWCCNQAGSARLCAHYSNKRPKIGCDGYQSPGTGSSEEAESDSEEQRDEDDE